MENNRYYSRSLSYRSSKRRNTNQEEEEALTMEEIESRLATKKNLLHSKLEELRNLKHTIHNLKAEVHKYHKNLNRNCEFRQVNDEKLMEFIEAHKFSSPFEGAGKHFNYSYSFGDLVEVKETRNDCFEFSRREGDGLYAFVVRETKHQVAVVHLKNFESNSNYSRVDRYEKFSVRKS